MDSCRVALSRTQCSRQERAAEPPAANSLRSEDNLAVQQLRVATRKTSACRSPWVGPIRPASLGLAFHDVCVHCSRVPPRSLEHRGCLSSATRKAACESLPATDPALPASREGRPNTRWYIGLGQERHVIYKGGIGKAERGLGSAGS